MIPVPPLRSSKRDARRRRTIAAVLTLAVATVVACVGSTSALAASTFTGGADDYPLFVPNDHTAVSIHFAASGLIPNQQYNVKLRFNTSATPGGSTNRGFTWSPSYATWVQERDASWNTTPNFFPVVTADASGAITGSAGWLFGKFGDTTASGTYYIIVSLEPVGSSSGATINAAACPAITVVDMATGGFWMHNGVATGIAAGKRAEADLDATSSVEALQKTETNACDDDGDGIVDNEDYGPSGKTGDFRLAVPTGSAFDIYLGSHVAWAPGQNKTSALADVDIAIGASDESAPTRVTGLSATPRNAAVDVSWEAASDNTSVTGYAVYRWIDPAAGSQFTALHSRIATVTSGTTYTDSGLTNGQTYHYEVRAVDAATNVGPRSAPASATPDGTAPVTGDDAPAGWIGGPVTITLTPVDGGSGVSSTSYRVDGGDWQLGTTVTLPVWKRGGGNGTHSVEFFSADNAGNVESTQSVSVGLDTQPPATANDAPVAPSTTDVTVHLTPVDTLSGVAGTWYRLDDDDWQSVSGPGGAAVLVTAAGNEGLHWIQYYSVDNVGRVENLRFCSVLISAPAAPAKTTLARRHLPRAVRR